MTIITKSVPVITLKKETMNAISPEYVTLMLLNLETGSLRTIKVLAYFILASHNIESVEFGFIGSFSVHESKKYQIWQ